MFKLTPRERCCAAMVDERIELSSEPTGLLSTRRAARVRLNIVASRQHVAAKTALNSRRRND
ncbi:MAG: hypothetical protein H0T51_17020 [Pirellulales bacterium]|nr:hypothetical protein [Pirellulales bacterium]